jgi:hypothetical protein
MLNALSRGKIEEFLKLEEKGLNLAKKFTKDAPLLPLWGLNPL